MDVQTLTYIIVGGAFAVYIGIALWSRASSTGEFYVAGGGVHPIAMVWLLLLIGCQLLHLFLWQESYLLWEEMALFI